MSEPAVPGSAHSAAPSAGGPVTAGGLLRQARQAQGVHIAVLAAAIKVVPRKLELLEADQFELLPDVTFTRALAQSVCRTLKIDPAPVLALLPRAPHAYRLEQVAEGLKTPFHEHSGGPVHKSWSSVATPVLWIAALIIVLTVAVYVVPTPWLPFGLGAGVRGRPASAPASEAAATAPASAASAGHDAAEAFPPDSPVVVVSPELGAEAATAPDAVASAAAAAPDLAAQRAAAEPAAASGAGVLEIRTTAPSWVGVSDGRGRSLIARVVQPGENVPLDGSAPFKLTIGNALGTQIVFKGQPIALASHTRDNVARFELK